MRNEALRVYVRNFSVDVAPRIIGELGGIGFRIELAAPDIIETNIVAVQNLEIDQVAGIEGALTAAGISEFNLQWDKWECVADNIS